MKKTAMTKSLMKQALRLTTRIERLLPPAPADIDWERTTMARWVRHSSSTGHLVAEPGTPSITIDDLLGIDMQKARVTANTEQFLARLPANDMLLWGPRGTGKSSLVRALIGSWHGAGLRAVEVDRLDLEHLPRIVDAIDDRKHRFLIFCDDLTFDSQDAGYKALKSILDGGLYQRPENILICATSNRRHLLPEYASDNIGTERSGTELHYAEGVEEKISLSDRFGLWLAFHPFDQATYLAIVAHWLARLQVSHIDIEAENYRADALRYALERGARSGRTAWHFARHYAGRAALATRNADPLAAYITETKA